MATSVNGFGRKGVIIYVTRGKRDVEGVTFDELCCNSLTYTGTCTFVAFLSLVCRVVVVECISYWLRVESTLFRKVRSC